MTILNNDILGNYVSIVPIKATFTDAFEANCLVASIVNDNLTDGCVIKFDLYNLITTIDPITNIVQLIYSNTISIIGDDYLNWQGNNSYVYTYIASKIPITLI